MVSSDELDVIVAPFTKPVPVKVMVVAVAPAMTEAGEAEVAVKTGAASTLTPTPPEVVYEPPVVFVTVTKTTPVFAVPATETDSVIKFGVTDDTVADTPLALGKVTVAPDKKPEPAT